GCLAVCCKSCRSRALQGDSVNRLLWIGLQSIRRTMALCALLQAATALAACRGLRLARIGPVGGRSRIRGCHRYSIVADGSISKAEASPGLGIRLARNCRRAGCPIYAFLKPISQQLSREYRPSRAQDAGSIRAQFLGPTQACPELC